MAAPRHIVCATDLSKESIPAIRMATTLGTSLLAKVTLLHVMEPLFGTPGVSGMALGGDSDLAERLLLSREVAVRERIAELCQQAGAKDLPFVVREATLPEGVIDALVELGADLLVVGTHRRTGLSHLLLGSVAERLVRSAPCPVLVCR